MKYEDLQGKEAPDFRQIIEFFVDKDNEYSKEDLYDAFVTVTKLYLDEIISARQLENLFLTTYGEDATNEFYEAVANSSKTVAYGDILIALEKDPKSAIKAQFDLINTLSNEGSV